MEGYLANRIEYLKGRQYDHLGGEEPVLKEFLSKFVPNVSDIKKVRVTVGILDE